MIVCDASVLIGHFDDRDPHHAAARSLLEASGAEALGASSITLAETLVAPARRGRLEETQALLAQLGVIELDFGEDAPGRLAMLRAKTGLKLPDCCVLAVAQEHTGSVASFDGNLVSAARRLGLPTAAPGTP